jgi:hypothetical protein
VGTSRRGLDLGDKNTGDAGEVAEEKERLVWDHRVNLAYDSPERGLKLLVFFRGRDDLDFRVDFRGGILTSSRRLLSLFPLEPIACGPLSTARFSRSNFSSSSSRSITNELFDMLQFENSATSG